MDSNSLPMVADLEVLPQSLRSVLLGLLVLGPLVLLGLVLAGAGSSPTVVVEATVVDAPPSDAAVYELSALSEGNPVRNAVEAALRSGSTSVEATTEAVRTDGVPATAFYVRHDGRVVKVTVRS